MKTMKLILLMIAMMYLLMAILKCIEMDKTTYAATGRQSGSVTIYDVQAVEQTVEENPYDIMESKTTEVTLTIEESTDCIVIEDAMVAESLPYSMDDYEVLVQLLTGECQNQNWECQIAVGSVALNRVAHENYPNSLYEVAHQKGQYACFSDGNAYREPTSLTLEVADYLLRNGSQLPADVIYQAQFRQGSGVYTKIGSEIFCYE